MADTKTGNGKAAGASPAGAKPSHSKTARAQPAASHCAAPEEVFFTCQMSGGKVLSLCGSGHPEPRIEYRYGRPGAIEMRHAAGLNPDDSTFRLAQYGRAQVQRNTVRFERVGVGYLVFDFQEGAKREAGVEITLPGAATERRLSCRAPVQAHLERLKGRLACDSDSALQLGKCP